MAIFYSYEWIAIVFELLQIAILVVVAIVVVGVTSVASLLLGAALAPLCAMTLLDVCFFYRDDSRENSDNIKQWKTIASRVLTRSSSRFVRTRMTRVADIADYEENVLDDDDDNVAPCRDQQSYILGLMVRHERRLMRRFKLSLCTCLLHGAHLFYVCLLMALDNNHLDWVLPGVIIYLIASGASSCAKMFAIWCVRHEWADARAAMQTCLVYQRKRAQ